MQIQRQQRLSALKNASKAKTAELASCKTLAKQATFTQRCTVATNGGQNS